MQNFETYCPYCQGKGSYREYSERYSTWVRCKRCAGTGLKKEFRKQLIAKRKAELAEIEKCG